MSIAKCPYCGSTTPEIMHVCEEMKQSPIGKLEHIMKSEPNTPVEIMPDGTIKKGSQVTTVGQSEAMRNLAERVELAIVVEKDDSPNFCTKPSLIQSLFDQIRNLQGQLDSSEFRINRLRTIILNVKNEVGKLHE